MKPAPQPEKSLAELALDYHAAAPAGKTALALTKPAETAYDLSLAYSPGVASPCLKIEKNPAAVYDYTNKGNLVGVISNGTAVLGLGNIGAAASKPVMEGKAMLFKKFANVDAFDIEINAPSPEVFIETVANISPTFGAINLEDIRAPECFFIEHRLRRRLDIPVMHDDQHGTAVVTVAALRNALELQNKKAENSRILVLGAGAAAVAITRMAMNFFGLKKRQILMFDSKGPLTSDRAPQLEAYKMAFVRDTKVKTLEAALRISDIVIGVARGGLIKPHMLKKMREKPIILAMSNPVPEIMPSEAEQVRSDLIMATGRSDFPNQVNNSICFPYLFRAALDAKAPKFTVPMFMAAVDAIADLAREPIPADVRAASGLADDAEFGPRYILPKQLDPRLRERVVPAVIKAAKEISALPATSFRAEL
ncbi:MAG: malate dehydrogenase [Betaproteobacteria bacterium]|nr:malate dehydrogenase [Betaproteobacteria bacterium]